MWWMQCRRWYWKARMQPSPLRDVFESPLPSTKTPYESCSYLAVDLETTGLDPKRDRILSMGCVEIHNAQIELGTATHTLVQTDKPITPFSVTIHRISDDMAAQGVSFEEAISSFLHAIKGKILIAHYASFELSFLSEACQTLYQAPLLIPAVDTLQIERLQRQRRQQPIKSGDLRLAKVRDSYHLPRYKAHHAFTDALAAAELFLAQTSYVSQGKRLDVGELLLRTKK